MNASIPRSVAIPKGVDGEVSKVVQCAAQMADAQQTRNPILALTDAACVLGSVKAWLRKHHPSISLDDLLKMYETTEQAMRPAPPRTEKSDTLDIPHFVRAGTETGRFSSPASAMKESGPFAPGTR